MYCTCTVLYYTVLYCPVSTNIDVQLKCSTVQIQYYTVYTIICCTCTVLYCPVSTLVYMM